MSTIHQFNDYQNDAYEQIKHWIDNDKDRVFRLKGAFGSGKLVIAKTLVRHLNKHNGKVILLAPDAETALSLKEREIDNVTSIYSWLYDEKPYHDEDILVYPIARESVNKKTDIIIILEAHLLSDSKFRSNEIQFGSGRILTDFINSFRDQRFNDRFNQRKIDSCPQFPKLLVIGDPYQLTRGDQTKCIVTCKPFGENQIDVTDFEIQTLKTTEPNKELFDFQRHLISQLRNSQFIELPSLSRSANRIVASKVDLKTIADEVSEFPQKAVYLTSKNKDVQSFNRFARQQKFGDFKLAHLISGDIVELRNKTLDLEKPEEEASDDDWIESGEIVQVVETIRVVHREPNLSFKNRNRDLLSIAEAKIRYSNGVGRIYYIPEFLTSEKPELSREQAILLHDLAHTEALDKVRQPNSNLDEIQKAEERRNTAYRRSMFNNAARLRYAYAMTVHRAQSFRRRLPKVYLDGRSAHDTANPATDSYFRRLYSVTTFEMKGLEICSYPELTPLSKTKWLLEESQISPIPKEYIFHFDQSRQLTDEEIEFLSKKGFSNLEPSLGIACISMFEIIEGSKWEIHEISHHRYLERYTFSNTDGRVRIDFNYNKDFIFKVGNIKVENGELSIATELKDMFQTVQIFQSQEVEYAVEYFEDHLNSKNWRITSVKEHGHSAILTVESVTGSARLLLDIPSTSINRNGIISRVKLLQVDDNDVLLQFKEDFNNG